VAGGQSKSGGSGKKPALKPDEQDRKSKTPAAPKAEKKPSGRIEIPLISTPTDQADMERDMEEIFNEEKVTHRHGGTEPERD
jgi:hypothetical protein